MAENADVFEDKDTEVTGPERVKEAVLVAAQRLFAERGIHAVSVREIAREVGVSHTLLHLYFGSKAEIVRQVLSRQDSRFAEQIASADDLAAAVGEVFRAVAQNGDIVRVLAAALVEGMIPEHIEAIAVGQQSLVAGLQKNTGTPAYDARAVTAMVASTVIGWAVAGDWISGSIGVEGMDRDELVSSMASMIEQSVRYCS